MSGEALKTIGIDVHTFSFPAQEADSQRINQYAEQIQGVVDTAFGKYWPDHVKEQVEASGIFQHMATTVWEAATILHMQTYPQLGLLGGYLYGKLNYNGGCWEDDDGLTWVGLDEMWFGDVCVDTIRENGAFPEFIKREISRVLAEEVFHAYIRETRPELAEANMQANASSDPADYWGSIVEQAAKEFADWYVSV